MQNQQPHIYKHMTIIRSADIGTYLYCQRAWWYRKSGYEPQNQAELAAGIHAHDQHGSKVQKADTLRKLAYFLLLAAGILAIVSLILQFSS